MTNTIDKGTNNFKPKKPKSTLGEIQKSTIDNKGTPKNVHKKKKTVGVKQNKKPNSTALR